MRFIDNLSSLRETQEIPRPMANIKMLPLRILEENSIQRYIV